MPAFKEISALLRASTKSIHLLSLATIATAGLTFVSSAIAQTPVSGAETKAGTTTQAKIEPLSGAELWAINCSRCHMARSPGEFMAAQWPNVMMHMRVRANLPAAQAREILKFLQSGAGK
jgi:mono/diheme cytochrome c family protein